MDDAACSSSGNIGEISEYERLRLKNIAELQLEYSDIIENVTNSAQDLATTYSGFVRSSTKRSQNFRQLSDVTVTPKKGNRPPILAVRRSKRLINDDRKPVYNENSDSDDDEFPSKLKVKFPFKKVNKEYRILDKAYYEDLNDDDFISDEEYYINHSSRSRNRRKVVPVSKITEAMLKNISYSTKKCHDTENGTTCHQCRQKTTDQKSYCRYKKCSGARGMFCGFCLGNRYGEDLATVLLNKKWACPVCRKYCNCSICRRKKGKLPTGQMVRIAEANGYNHVNEMIEAIEGKYLEINLSSNYDSDEEDQDKEDVISESINLDKDVFKTEQRYDKVVSEIKNLPDDLLNLEMEFDQLYEREYGQKIYP